MTAQPQARRLTGSSISLAPLVLAAALTTSFIVGAATTALIGAASQANVSAPGAAPAAEGFGDGSYDAVEHTRLNR